jgi:hypothetical protein
MFSFDGPLPEWQSNEIKGIKGSAKKPFHSAQIGKYCCKAFDLKLVFVPLSILPFFLESQPTIFREDIVQTSYAITPAFGLFSVAVNHWHIGRFRRARFLFPHCKTKRLQLGRRKVFL